MTGVGHVRLDVDYSGTDDVTVFLPSGGAEGAIPVIWCHGLFGTATSPEYRTYAQFGDDLEALTVLGYPVFVADFGGASTWGIDSSWGLIGTVRTRAGTVYGCRTDRVALIGDSMGALTALNYAWRNLSAVVAVALRVPVLYFEDFRNRNEASFGGAIDGAWGSYAAWQAGLPTHDPGHPTQIAALRGISDRGRIWYADADEFVAPLEVERWSAATGWPADRIVGTHAAGFTTSIRDVTRHLIVRLDAA